MGSSLLPEESCGPRFLPTHIKNVSTNDNIADWENTGNVLEPAMKVYVVKKPRK